MTKSRRRTEPWDCPNCGTRVEADLGVCWNCGATPDGRVDPGFVREVDVESLPPDWVARIRCEACGYTGKALVGHPGYRWWMLPFAAALVFVLVAYFGFLWLRLPVSVAVVITLLGLAPWWVLFVLLGNLNFKACPSCDEREQLVDYDGSESKPTMRAEQIWRARQDADDRAFRANKRILLIVTLVAFCATFWFYFIR